MIAFDGADRVTLASTAPAPPGCVMDATIEAGYALDASESIRIKVRGCKRDGERFVIDARVLDVSRHLRNRLSALAANE